MKSKVFLGIVVAMIISTSAAFASNVIYGASGAMEAKTLSTADMLKYAMEDEYLARGEYIGIQDKFGAQRPFSNIQNAETTHIALLTDLYKTYKLEVPKDLSSKYVVLPKTINDAYAAGVEAEKSNIAMYDKFLKQVNLPADVKLVFERLKSASQMHLNAFSNAATGTGYGNGMGRARGIGTNMTNGYGGRRGRGFNR